MANCHTAAETSLIMNGVPRDENPRADDRRMLSSLPVEIHRNQAYQGYRQVNRQHQPSTSQIGPRNFEVPQTLVVARDKKFTVNMKRFILSSLGAPGIPGASRYTQITCSAVAAPFYTVLLIWGVILMFISFDKKVEVGGHSIYIFTSLVGIYFILLGIFWGIVFGWSKLSKKTSKLTSFSLVVTVWFVLCFYSIAAASALTALLAAFQEEKSFQGYQVIPALALGSVYLLWTVHIAVFFVNVCCNLFGS